MITWFALWYGVFFAAFAYDWCAAHYVATSTAGRARAAANWSAMTAIMGLIGLTGVIQIDRLLAIPEIVGVWMGTWLAVSRRNR